MAGALGRVAARAAGAPDWQVVAAFVAFAAFSEWGHIASPDHDVADAARSVGIALAFALTGLLARRRQPDNHTGVLLVLVGFAVLAEDIFTAHNRLLITIGGFLTDASAPALAWLVLAFPTGRLARARERWLVIALAVTVGLLQKNQAGITAGRCPECDDSLSSYLYVGDVEWIYKPLGEASQVIIPVLVGMVALVVLDRWRRSSRPARRVLSPFLTVAAFIAAASVAATTVAEDGTPAHDPAIAAVYVGTLCLPFAFLLGIARLELARVNVVESVMALGPRPQLADLRAAASRALGDPLLRVLRRDGSALRDEADRVVTDPGEELATTELRHDDRPLGVLVHDPALRQDRRLIEAVTGVLAEALDKERRALQAEMQAEEIRRAGERLRAAAEEERRRIERDLHDGAQQRIASAALWLDILQMRIEQGDQETANEVMARLSRELDAAIDELRQLARGTLPRVLIDGGLDVALQALADRTPIAVTIVGTAGPDVPPALSGAAYFAVAEGLTNAIRHSGAQAIELGVGRRDGELELTVRDDGRGGADMDSGSGLRGLAARLSAHGGTLDLESPPGQGTTLRVRLPLAGGAAAVPRES